ncbi:MAG: substrate-binding domain-containing protein, partial [Propionivibrio sp.]|nr:substrate-binding domain-containing protein [Propionivibrio sp.]
MKPSSSRSFALICLAAALETSPVHAINLGISYASASGEMPAAFRTAIKQYTQEKERVNALVTDAQNDSLREMEGIQNFIAVKVDAMIVAPVDSMSTQKITSMAKKAGIPLVLLDASFNETGSLRRVSTVGAGENRPGVVQMREVCRLMGGSGNVVVLTEDPVKSAARERMQEVEEVVSKAPCDRIKIIDRRQGGA